MALMAFYLILFILTLVLSWPIILYNQKKWMAGPYMDSSASSAVVLAKGNEFGSIPVLLVFSDS